MVVEILCCSRMKLSTAQTAVLDAVKADILLLDFAQQLRTKKKKADVPDLYFILLYLTLLV